MAKMTGFIFQDGYLEQLAKLSDQELGRLVRALAIYHSTGETKELAGRESIAYDFIKVDIDRIEQGYANKCETNRNNRVNSITIDNDRQRPSTTGNEQAQDKVKDKIKDKVKIKKVSADADTKESQRPSEKLPNGFDRFWEVYPRKMAKAEAVKAFEKIKPDAMLIETMVKAVLKQRLSAQWKEDNGKYIPLPATWLNQRRWDDEMPTAQSTGKVVNAAKYTQREYTEDELAGDTTDELMREAAML